MFLRIRRIINDLRDDFTKTDGFTMIFRFTCPTISLSFTGHDPDGVLVGCLVLFGQAFRAAFENICGDQTGVE